MSGVLLCPTCGTQIESKEYDKHMKDHGWK